MAAHHFKLPISPFFTLIDLVVVNLNGVSFLFVLLLHDKSVPLDRQAFRNPPAAGWRGFLSCLITSAPKACTASMTAL